MGGGCGISMHAPIRIATERTIWAMPENSIGFFTDCGASYFLTRLPNIDKSIGIFLSVTGHRVTGKDLLKYGLATHYVPSTKIEELKHKIIEVTR